MLAEMAGSWRDDVDAPAAVRDQLPRGYDLVGHVAILHLIDPLSSLDPSPGFQASVAEALIEAVPPARTAAIDQGVEGELRTRAIQVIGGDRELVTEHKENGCRLIVDLETCYFSPRLAGERARVAEQIEPGERVLDMYCGVGPYAVLAAKQGASVVAVDLNPAASRLAWRNAKRNKVADRVDVVCADGQALADGSGPVFDHIIMNLPHDAPAHLGAARQALKPGGRIHLGAMIDKDEHEQAAAGLAEEHGLALAGIVHVRNYNPAVGHYCIELDGPAA